MSNGDMDITSQPAAVRALSDPSQNNLTWVGVPPSSPSVSGPSGATANYNYAVAPPPGFGLGTLGSMAVVSDERGTESVYGSRGHVPPDLGCSGLNFPAPRLLSANPPSGLAPSSLPQYNGPCSVIPKPGEEGRHLAVPQHEVRNARVHMLNYVQLSSRRYLRRGARGALVANPPALPLPGPGSPPRPRQAVLFPHLRRAQLQLPVPDATGHAGAQAAALQKADGGGRRAQEEAYAAKRVHVVREA